MSNKRRQGSKYANKELFDDTIKCSCIKQDANKTKMTSLSSSTALTYGQRVTVLINSGKNGRIMYGNRPQHGRPAPVFLAPTYRGTRPPLNPPPPAGSETVG